MQFVLSIDWFRAAAIPFLRIQQCGLPQHTHLKQLRQNFPRRFMSTELRNFLSLSYDELEELNLKAKEQRKNRVAAHKVQEERIKYLTDEKRIKAVTVLFSDLEGRLHMLDYDKKFLIKSWDNLTFDGSSNSRLYGAAGERFAAGDGLAFVLLGSGRRFRLRQGAGFRPRHRQRRFTVRRRHSRRSERLCRAAA